MEEGTCGVRGIRVVFGGGDVRGDEARCGCEIRRAGLVLDGFGGVHDLDLRSARFEALRALLRSTGAQSICYIKCSYGAFLSAYGLAAKRAAGWCTVHHEVIRPCHSCVRPWRTCGAGCSTSGWTGGPGGSSTRASGTRWAADPSHWAADPSHWAADPSHGGG